MTGRYLILSPCESWLDEKRFDAAWRKVTEICRSLHRDGLDYSVELKLTDACPHVLITASGIVKPRRYTSARALSLPMPIPAERCRDRALAVCGKMRSETRYV